MLINFGTTELKLLLKQFSAQMGLDETQIFSEYNLFKQVVFDQHRQLPFTAVCQLLQTVYKQAYPNVAKLCAVVAVMPSGSVDCERGFSQQNLIKTKQRNRL